MEPGQLATLTMLAGLIVDKAMARFNVTWYDGVKRLHCGCSSCMEFDVDRTTKTPPGSPTSLSGQFELPTTTAPQPLLPTKSSSEGAIQLPDPVVRRVSVPESLVTFASHQGSG